MRPTRERLLLLLAAGMSCGGQAEAKLLPKADVVLNCFENDVPKPACTFICGGG